MMTDGLFNYHINDAGEAVIEKYNGKEEHIIIPASLGSAPVAEIGPRAFSGPSLKTVAFPDTLIRIGDSAFASCSCIERICLPDSVRKIGVEAFIRCETLSYVELNDGLEEIGDGAFSSCENLKAITLPESLLEIGDGAFSRTSLSSLNIPANLKVFHGNPVSDCRTMRALEVADVNPVIKWRDGILIDTAANKVIMALPNERRAHYAIPHGITSIDSYAFDSCRYITAVELPLTLQEIGEGAFIGCSGLYKVVVPEGVKSIDAFAFNGCSNLTELWLPDSLQEISWTAINESVPYLHIIGGKGAYAEAFCSDNDIPFIDRNDTENIKDIPVWSEPS